MPHGNESWPVAGGQEKAPDTEGSPDVARHLMPHENFVDDTICAIATPVGEGGVGIIRVSGSHAIDVASHVIRPRNRQSLHQLENHRLYVSDIVCAQESHRPHAQSMESRVDGEAHALIDEALVVVMRQPRSYTGEDVVEIQTHGGTWILRATCNALIHHGAKLAQPGEFTKRAFLNGRLDLTQAEAVLDTIQATTSRSLQAAQSLLRGSLSREIDTLRERVLRVLAHLEAGMDFVEEDIEFIQRAEVQRVLEETQGALEKLIASFEEGRMIREGVKVAIVGRPNVGKSSLLNALLNVERAIVSDQPGTTRDVIDESINVNGIALRLLDTAGLRRTQDEVEGEGIRRTEEAMSDADVVLFVMDGAQGVTDEDRAVFEMYGSRRPLLVMNKMDLPESRSFDARKMFFPLPLGEGQGEGGGKAAGPSQGEGLKFVKVSAKTGEGLDQLTAVIQGVCLKEGLEATPSVLVTRLRHKASLERAHHSIEEAMRSLERKESGECVALDIRVALEALGEITGAVSTEDILDRIFQDFCIGK